MSFEYWEGDSVASKSHNESILRLFSALERDVDDMMEEDKVWVEDKRIQRSNAFYAMDCFIVTLASAFIFLIPFIFSLKTGKPFTSLDLKIMIPSAITFIVFFLLFRKFDKKHSFYQKSKSRLEW